MVKPSILLIITITTMTTTLKLEWIKKINPYYWDNLLEGEEILSDELWCFDETQWTERNAEIVRESGMIPIEVDGLLFCGLATSGMDLTAQVVYTQYKLTGFIEEDDACYLKWQRKDFVEFVIGEKARNELIECANKFYKDIMIDEKKSSTPKSKN